MRIDTSDFNGLKYLVRYPKEYAEGERYPVIVFLHGAGSRGTDIESLCGNPYFKITETHEKFPFVTVAPLCSGDSWFDHFERLRGLTQKVAEESFADKERIYLMGASMGGYATWQLAMSCPELFAAIVPICGGGMYWNAARLVGLPVWAFHGRKDPTVLAEESEKMVSAVKAHGGDARLTVYPDAAHNAWSDTYRNYEVFEWLLSHRRSATSGEGENFSGSEIYG